uniref:Uncharacterized protein n=1 Tax=Asparagus officinalis TaxID=4686 RepID=Q2AA75_ASPOF|nr:hypothetical protein 18.t00003 [Asparagus officinalis]
MQAGIVPSTASTILSDVTGGTLSRVQGEECRDCAISILATGGIYDTEVAVSS